MNYSTDSFFKMMHNSQKAAPLSHSNSAEVLKSEIEFRRSELEKVLGLDKIKAINFDLKAEKGSAKRYDVNFMPELTMPIWVLKPEHSNGKTVLYLPGHDEKGAKGSFNYYGQNKTFHKWLPLQLQYEGFTVVIPEFMGFGDMIKEEFNEDYHGCYANTALLAMFGISMAGIRVYQAMCAMKVARELAERPIDMLYGISGGGLVAMCLAALEPNFEAVVISNYGASFKSSIMPIRHCIDNYIPNLLTVGECADILGLCAPMPLMLTNGISDRIFPVEGVKETADELKKIYSIAGNDEAFFNHLHGGGHETDSDAVINYLKSFIINIE